MYLVTLFGNIGSTVIMMRNITCVKLFIGLNISNCRCYQRTVRTQFWDGCCCWRAKMNKNQPSPPLHPGKVHGAPLSRLAHASDREEHLPRDRTGEEHQYEWERGHAAYYRETINRNETLDSGEAKTLRKQFVSRSVYSPVNIMHAINIRSTKFS